jgi:hypothetical protein
MVSHHEAPHPSLCLLYERAININLTDTLVQVASIPVVGLEPVSHGDCPSPKYHSPRVITIYMIGHKVDC